MRKIIKSTVKKSIGCLCKIGKYTDNNSFCRDQSVIRLKKLAESVNAYIQKERIQPKLRILVPTSFNISSSWWVHDGIISAALRMRGMDIIPTICDMIQSDECMFFGGEWQESRASNFKEVRNNICHDCMERASEMWNIWGLNPVRLKSFVTTDEINEIKEQVSQLMKSDWIDLDLDGYPAGYEAWKATVNNDLQATISDWWTDRANILASKHLFNIMILTKAYKRVFDIFLPDRVFGNGGFYYFWGVVSHIANKRNIPYYRYFKVGLHQQSWNYARNSLKLIDVDLAWQSWLKEPWSLEKERRVDHDLSLRGLKKLPDKEIKETHKDIINQLKLDINKPIVLAFTGVAWDATSNFPSEAYKNMYEWLWDTIDWFKENPDIQLIIRVHPGENIAININPENRTRFEIETNSKKIKVPANVHIVSFDNPVSSYDLFHIATLGMVYSSTTGLEMACLGIPVITIGQAHYSNKGFTYDPKSRKEYFDMLRNSISNRSENACSIKISKLAKKYWYLYAFHSQIPIITMEKYKNGLMVPKNLTYKHLLPGTNPYLDYICDAIINDLPIMGENRWPPDRTENF